MSYPFKRQRCQSVYAVAIVLGLGLATFVFSAHKPAPKVLEKQQAHPIELNLLPGEKLVVAGWQNTAPGRPLQRQFWYLTRYAHGSIDDFKETFLFRDGIAGQVITIKEH